MDQGNADPHLWEIIILMLTVVGNGIASHFVAKTSATRAADQATAKANEDLSKAVAVLENEAKNIREELSEHKGRFETYTAAAAETTREVVNKITILGERVAETNIRMSSLATTAEIRQTADRLEQAIRDSAKR